ncbi:unnamed protein product [Acanthoscelides obtectus]|uniref:Uncharacterized protein n=1 Tax=Acanthoscelides obtectus TaxID=200917 RepID=A0A9P0LAE2_ACAOB|nr:unnamed protein product [Acanthoscelides obtectus]CAK1684047.1 hypothetical protein AOBTE_LOCUS34591 [Acanthoscelides obtectus]
MFKRQVSPEKPAFSIKKEDILEDIESIKGDEEQRKKLFYCIDENPPLEQKFSGIEDILAGTNSLDNTSKHITALIQDLQSLSEDLQEGVAKIRKQISGLQK